MWIVEFWMNPYPHFLKSLYCSYIVFKIVIIMASFKCHSFTIDLTQVFSSGPFLGLSKGKNYI